MLKMMISIAVFLLSSWTGAATLEPLQGTQALSSQTVEIHFPSARKTVLIFMSTHCPCSGSHEILIKDMITKYKDLQFFIVVANANETLAEIKEHFSKAQMGAPVIHDEKAKWADRFGALKTPHAFVLDEKGVVLYQGGVTDSHVGPQAKTKYLEEVLQDITEGKKPRRSEGRALGCYIQRENS